MTFLFKKIGGSLLLVCMVMTPFLVSAAEPLPGGGSNDTVEPAPTAKAKLLGVKFENPFGDNINSIPQFIGKIVDLLINFGGVIVVFFIILSGFKFVIAQGSPDKIQSAKKMLLWTLIGALVLLGSKVISEIIQSTLSEFTK